MIKPYHARLFSYIKSRSSAKIVYHTCGSVVHLIPDLIEMGVDALNPIQVSAKGMDSKTLKREFGKDICFWGGIDTQRVLPFGSVRGRAGGGEAADRGPGAGRRLRPAPSTTSRPMSRPRTSARCTTPPGNSGRRTRGREPESSIP